MAGTPSRAAAVVVACLAAAGAHGRDERPAYNSDPKQQIEAGVDAVTRKADPDQVLQRKSVDAQVLTLGKGGWGVAKEGSHGLGQRTATIIRRDTNGMQIAAGRGIRDRSANRFAKDIEVVSKLLAQSQKFTYEITEAWGFAEDIEKYGSGDCADKSLWLAAKLGEAGFDDVRVVLGRRDNAETGHAWVEMTMDGDEYFLETTSDEPPLPAARARPRYYSEHPPRAMFDRQRGFMVVKPAPAGRKP